jgi:hypothetical protein
MLLFTLLHKRQRSSNLRVAFVEQPFKVAECHLQRLRADTGNFKNMVGRRDVMQRLLKSFESNHRNRFFSCFVVRVGCVLIVAH